MCIIPYISFPVLQIDLQKMPLGKLSKRQIQSAYALLTEVQQVSNSSSRKDISALNLTFVFTLIQKDLWIFFLHSNNK